MMSPRIVPVILAIIVSQIASESVRAEDASTTETKKSEVEQESRKFMQTCTFASGKMNTVKLELRPEPILRWSNPTVGDVHGEVHVWTDRGRPVVVTCYYRFFTPDWGSTLEVSSVSETEATGTIDGIRFWATPKPGMTRKELPAGDPPAKNAEGRLVQMRRLAGDFSVELQDTRTRGSGVQRSLRLLSKPVFRYPPPTQNSAYVDGALFAFVEGTDPELLLTIEAISVNDSPTWHFGLARMNRDEMRVKFQGAEVWSVPFLEDVLNRPKEPYGCFGLRSKLKDTDP